MKLARVTVVKAYRVREGAIGVETHMGVDLEIEWPVDVDPPAQGESVYVLNGYSQLGEPISYGFDSLDQRIAAGLLIGASSASSARVGPRKAWVYAWRAGTDGIRSLLGGDFKPADLKGSGIGMGTAKKLRCGDHLNLFHDMITGAAYVAFSDIIRSATNAVKAVRQKEPSRSAVLRCVDDLIESGGPEAVTAAALTAAVLAALHS